MPSALNIIPKPKEDTTAKMPKPLNIEPKPSKLVVKQTSKSFELSFEYLKAKVPMLTTFVYSQVKDILCKIDAEDAKKRDTNILNFGKQLQESVATRTMSINALADSNLIDKIQASHNNIITSIELSKKGFFQKLFSKSMNKDEVQALLRNEVAYNKSYRAQLEENSKRHPIVLQQFNTFLNEMELYIEIIQVLKDEFETEGFVENIDLIHKRTISLIQSKTMLMSTINMVEMYKQKSDLYIDHIDNTVNLLIPTIIVKMSADNYSDDIEFQQLSDKLLNTLKNS
jgi:hypothetical protein